MKQNTSKGFLLKVNGVSVCYEKSSVWIKPQSYIKDVGGPFGTGLQELVSNHLMLHWLIVFVVSDKEKVLIEGLGNRRESPAGCFPFWSNQTCHVYRVSTTATTSGDG